MNEIYSTLILFGVGLVAGFLNVTAGGGSTLTLPALIFLGLDSALANGTNRVAIAIQNISAIYSFKKEKYGQFKTSMKLSLLTLPGGIIGAVAAVKIGDELFQTILGIIMIGVIITMLIPKSSQKFEANHQNIKWTVYLSMFFIGFYGGFVQVGVGFILMAALHYLMQINLVYVNMHKVFIILIYTIPALLIFIFTGNVNWQFGLSLAAGNALGGWWAAKVSVKKGENVIRYVLLVAIFIMSLKLLNVF
ncbi:MAG: sulfite exporter TauE/SafE family protein [Melioribacteraceae bacterium]|nr:sulfite exporter TauE/SafE family protein [Melioribacteraceae bacterium]MCF8355072.1 sulfite exporter TauE/SafE family protein [Melioribacteraceae bacterium]MCF8395665.1 sulfite exporter TauE/SafE family protein [Melioribacteraceae bacterium]MCF8420290.1 sulfite exporter TauE/SafE family protein [Melioribacteraceae bacterium]